jgi:hypothetical protein
MSPVCENRPHMVYAKVCRGMCKTSGSEGRFVSISIIHSQLMKSTEQILSRHDPTAPDATPLSPDARRDTTNVRPKVRAMPSVRSFIISQIWNLQRLVSPSQPRLYLVFPP